MTLLFPPWIYCAVIQYNTACPITNTTEYFGSLSHFLVCPCTSGASIRHHHLHVGQCVALLSSSLLPRQGSHTPGRASQARGPPAAAHPSPPTPASSPLHARHYLQHSLASNLVSFSNSFFFLAFLIPILFASPLFCNTNGNRFLILPPPSTFYSPLLSCPVACRCSVTVVKPPSCIRSCSYSTQPAYLQLPTLLHFDTRFMRFSLDSPAVTNSSF